MAVLPKSKRDTNLDLESTCSNGMRSTIYIHPTVSD